MYKTATQVDRATQKLIVSSYVDGTSVSDLAQLLGITPVVVRRVLADNEAPMRVTQDTLEDRNAAILNMRKSGKTLGEIAKTFRLTKQRVHAIVSRGY